MNLDNTYWNHNGKYQKEYNEIKKDLPDFGSDTDNVYVNGLIVLSNIYYDVYNNGGINLKSDIMSNGIIENKESELEDLYDTGEIKSMRLNTSENTLYKNFKNSEKLEKLMDEIVQLVWEKGWDYTQ